MALTRLWAPFPRNVLMVVGGKPSPMVKEDRGWWTLDSPYIVHGTDYAFVLDGSDPLPDPRSPWQPYGVHGFSRVFDHSLFPWADTRWQPPPLSSAVIYELHVGTFSPQGTFKGIIELLDHLVDLGITHVELMPVNSFPGNGVGDTTGSISMLPMSRTEVQRASRAWWMRAMQRDSPSSSMSFITILDRMEIISNGSDRTLPTIMLLPGARQ